MDDEMRTVLVRAVLEQARQEAGEPWWIQKKTFTDGRVAYLHQTLFNLRISISRDEHDLGFNEFYCFHDSSAAFVAMATWDGIGDPAGWDIARHLQPYRYTPAMTSSPSPLRGLPQLRQRRARRRAIALRARRLILDS